MNVLLKIYPMTIIMIISFIMIIFDADNNDHDLQRHLIPATSNEKEELKVSLVSGAERQTNTFEVKKKILLR